jgi:hypothetical protein
LKFSPVAVEAAGVALAADLLALARHHRAEAAAAVDLPDPVRPCHPGDPDPAVRRVQLVLVDRQAAGPEETREVADLEAVPVGADLVDPVAVDRDNAAPTSDISS